jgi:hypothetical protein
MLQFLYTNRKVVMKRPSPLPTVIPTFRRSFVERGHLVVGVVSLISIVVVLLDVFVWRPM